MDTNLHPQTETGKAKSNFAERLRGVPIIEGRPQQHQLEDRDAKQRDRRFTAVAITDFGVL